MPQARYTRMARSLVSMIILIVIIIVLFSLEVSSKTCCPGTCQHFPSCDAYCKSKGYQIGQCVPPENYFCCCAKVDEQISNYEFSSAGCNQPM
ncbi:hypothetical protein CR513_57502, partial [Mucuna pruriens]